jgi:hypothetical protein
MQFVCCFGCRRMEQRLLGHAVTLVVSQPTCAVARRAQEVFDYTLQRAEGARWRVDEVRLQAICEALPCFTQQTLLKAVSGALHAESGAALKQNEINDVSADMYSQWQQMQRQEEQAMGKAHLQEVTSQVQPVGQSMRHAGHGQAGRCGRSIVRQAAKLKRVGEAAMGEEDAGSVHSPSPRGSSHNHYSNNAFDAARRAQHVKANGSCRSPLILLLDEPLQQLPWESIPVLREHPVSRLPCGAFVRQCAGAATSLSVCRGAASLNSAYYVLNPSGDLQRTQRTLEEQIARPPWEGVVGEPPDPMLLKVCRGLFSSSCGVPCSRPC